MINVFLDLHNPRDFSIVFVFFIISYLAYFIFYFFANWKKVNVKHLFLLIFILNIIFIFIPFLTSNDLYSYIFQTRILPIFGKNPYLVPYDAFRSDILYPTIKTVWSQETTLHGPLFLLIGGFINKIAKDNLVVLILLFKSVLIGANILSARFIYLVSKNKKSLFLYGLNPLVIFELAGNAHADSLLILFLIIGFYLTNKEKVVKGYASFVASALIKYSTFMLFPYQLVYFLKKKGLKTVLIAIIFGFIMIVLIYLPFWQGIKIFNYLMIYYNGRYISPSLGIFVGQSLLGSYEISFQLNTIIFLLISGFLGIRTLVLKPKFSFFLLSSLIVYWTYLATKLSLVLAWDLTPLIAIGSLCLFVKKYQKVAIASIIFTSFYSLALYYFVR